MAFHKPLDPPTAAGPACKHLRSKGMYILGLADPADDPLCQVGDGHCWCNLTAGQLGPDHQVVDRPACNASRGCYEAPL